MKKLELLFLASLSIGTAAMAQMPTPDPDTLRDPIQQGDPVPHSLPPQSDYREQMKVVAPSALPSAVQKTLKAKEYQGWEKGTIYHSAKDDIYLIEIQEPIKTRTFRLTSKGERLEDRQEK